MVDPGLLVSLDQLGDLIGRSDRAAQGTESLLEELHPERLAPGRDDVAREPLLGAVLLELVPQVRDGRLVLSEDVVVRERIAEEVAAVDAALDRGLLVFVAHHRQDDGDVRVDRETDRHALVRLKDLVVLVGPLFRVFGIDECE